MATMPTESRKTPFRVAKTNLMDLARRLDRRVISREQADTQITRLISNLNIAAEAVHPHSSEEEYETLQWIRKAVKYSEALQVQVVRLFHLSDDFSRSSADV